MSRILHKDELEMIVYDAMDRFEADYGEPGVDRLVLENLINDAGGDEHDLFAALARIMEHFYGDRPLPGRIIN